MDSKNLVIRVLKSEKRTSTDSYEHGQDPDSEKVKDLDARVVYPSVVDAFREIVKDPTIQPDQIGTMDPNIYCDVKGGGYRTVEDNTAKGLFRCLYDRTENSHGRKPSAAETADFEAGKIDLKAATYEIIFNIQVVGLDEKALAEFLGVNNW
jgi:hypothetical protein